MRAPRPWLKIMVRAIQGVKIPGAQGGRMKADSDDRRAGALEIADTFAGSLLFGFCGDLFRRTFGGGIACKVDLGQPAGLFDVDVAYEHTDRVGGIIVFAVKCDRILRAEIFHVGFPADDRVVVGMGAVGHGIEIEPGCPVGIVDIAKSPFALNDLFFDIKFAPGGLEKLLADDGKPLFAHVRRDRQDILGLVFGGKGIDPHRPVFAQLGGKGLGHIYVLDFPAQARHFSDVFFDDIRIGIPFPFFSQDPLIGRFDPILQQVVFEAVGGAEIFGALEHHVFQKVGDTGFAGGLECGAGPDGDPGGNLRGARAFDDQKQHPVVKLERLDLYLQIRFAAGGRSGIQAGDQQQNGDKEYF